MTGDNDNGGDGNSATGNEVNDDGIGALGNDNDDDDDGDDDNNGDGDGARWAAAQRDTVTTRMATGKANNDVDGDSATGNEVDNDGDSVTGDDNDDDDDNDDAGNSDDDCKDDGGGR